MLFPVFTLMSANSSPIRMPSRSGMCPRTANPPDSSPPSTALVSIIFGATFLKPTGTS